MAEAATVISVLGINIQAGMIAAIGTLAAGCGGCWAKIRSEARETRREQAETRKQEKAALDAELQPMRSAIATFKSKEALAEDKADLQRDIDKVAHDLKNAQQDIKQLDRLRQDADKWRAEVNTTLANFRDGQARIERDMREGFARLEHLLIGRHGRSDEG